MLLHNKKVIITGATGLLGSYLVKEFIANGARVAAVGRDKEKLASLKKQVQLQNEWLQVYSTDLANEKSARLLLNKIIKKWGHVDILVNAAGGYWGGKMLHETSFSDWQNMFAVNLHTAFNCSKEVMAYMVKHFSGKIINIAAMAVYHIKPGKGAYTVSKAALIALTEAMAAEGKQYNVQVNAIAPGMIRTKESDDFQSNSDKNSSTLEEIANTVIFLCTENAATINGTIIKMVY